MVSYWYRIDTLLHFFFLERAVSTCGYVLPVNCEFCVSVVSI